MQHKRPRLMAKILAFVLAVSLVFPVSAFASVADLADDTRVPGKSLANTYPNLPVDWQVSLAEDTKDVTVRVPVSLTADELTAAIEAQSISFSLVPEPREVPQPLGGRHTGSVGHPEQQRDRPDV